MSDSQLKEKSKMAQDKVVLYHGDCDDGFTAAWVAWKIFGDSAIYEAAYFGKDIKADITDREVYILDFSFEPAVLEGFLRKAKRVCLLDHHKTAFDKLKHYSCCHFDMNKSGAGLAWEKFFPGLEMPEIVKHVQDNDLWKFEYPETKAFIFGLRAQPMTFEVWDSMLNEKDFERVMMEGKVLEKFYAKEIDYIAQFAVEVVIDGVKGLAVNCPRVFVSDIGALLAEKCGTYALIWMHKEDGIDVSVRSTKDFNGGALAQKFGGGGHPQSAGFRLDSLEELQSKIFQNKAVKLSFSK